jgi:hypothetical protein
VQAARQSPNFFGRRKDRSPGSDWEE